MSEDEIPNLVPPELVMWVEKYKPKSFDEVVGQPEIVLALRSMAELVKNGDPRVQHMLFEGPPGVGKSLLAELFAMACHGPTYEEAYEVLDASGKERGIKTVRETIPKLAQYVSPGYVINIIFLDEADMMTSELQHALRGTMVKYSDTTLFLLAANYSHKIIEPIRTSRCMPIRFTPIDAELMKERIVFILNEEGVRLAEETIDMVVKTARGDMRAAINRAQYAALLYSNGVADEMITRIMGRFTSFDINQVLGFCQAGNFTRVDEYISNMLMSGAPGVDFINSLSDIVFIYDRIDAYDKMEILGQCAFAVDAIINGSPERVQVNAVLSKIFIAMMPGGGHRSGQTRVVGGDDGLGALDEIAAKKAADDTSAAFAAAGGKIKPIKLAK